MESLNQHPQNKETDALDRIASAEDCRVLDEELNTLPVKYREVLVMTCFGGQSSQHIAD